MNNIDNEFPWHWDESAVKDKIKQTKAFQALVEAGGYEGGIEQAASPVIQEIYGRVLKREDFGNLSALMPFMAKHQRLVGGLLRETLGERVDDIGIDRPPSTLRVSPSHRRLP